MDTAEGATTQLDQTMAADVDTCIADQLAWSVDPDAHTEVAITPATHSWKIPIAVVLLSASAVVTAGATFGLLHHPVTQAPAVTQPAPAPAPKLTMAPADKTFTDSLAAVNFPHFHVGQTPAQYDANTIAVGRGICELLNVGNPADQTIQLIHDKYHTVLTLPQTRVLVDDAIAAYCPTRMG